MDVWSTSSSHPSRLPLSFYCIIGRGLRSLLSPQRSMVAECPVYSLCALGTMLPRSGRVPFLLPKPQYSFLNLSCEIVWQVNDVAISLFAIVRLIRSMWHLNERLLAFRLDNLYV